MADVERTQREVVHVQVYPPRSLGAYLLDIGTGPELRPMPPFDK